MLLKSRCATAASLTVNGRSKEFSNAIKTLKYKQMAGPMIINSTHSMSVTTNRFGTRWK